MTTTQKRRLYLVAESYLTLYCSGVWNGTNMYSVVLHMAFSTSFIHP